VGHSTCKTQCESQRGTQAKAQNRAATLGEMEPRHIIWIVYALACACYAALALRAASRMQGMEFYRPAGLELRLPWVALLAHVTLLGQDFHNVSGMRFGFAQALTLFTALGVLFFLLEERYVRIHVMRPMVFGAAAVALPLPLWFNGVVLPVGHPLLKAHLWLAMVAYAIVGIAAVHAVMMVVVDRGLHRKSLERSHPVNPLRAVLQRNAPALVPLEHLLFRMLFVGFVVLSIALALGVVVAEGAGMGGLRVDHKTVFSVLAWATLLGLLLGRWLGGWRGRTAVRWTLWGFLMLSLAYVGSRFVAEAILHRLG
jgi:ABC-type uncharacterized transport system permease subunit